MSVEDSAHRSGVSEHIEQLRAFARDILDAGFDGNLDGIDIQNLGIQHGLLVETVMDAPCGESCRCADYCTDDFPVTCFRFTDVLSKSGQEAAK